MVQEVTVNVKDQTGAVQQKGFGLPLIFDSNTDAAYQEVTSTDEISTFGSGDIAYEQANIMLSQDPAPQKVALYGVDVATAGTSISTELNNLITEHNDWYWGVLASRTEADITDFSSWLSVQKKVGAAQLDISTTASGLETYAGSVENSRLALFAHDGGTGGTDPYLAAGTVGRLAALTVGDWTAKFKTINTVPAATWSPGDISTIEGANINTYVTNMGENYISEGIMSNGDFIDTQVAKDWVSARYQEGIFRILKNYNKIPFDNSGISQVISAIKEVNAQAARNGIVAEDAAGNYQMSVSYPRRRDLADNDIANRNLTGIESTIVFGGAIHEVKVDFVLTL